MSRPTIRTVQVRARDLVPGDVMLSTVNRTAQVWHVVASVTPVLHDRTDENVRVRYTNGGGDNMQAVSLITIQKEIPSS